MAKKSHSSIRTFQTRSPSRRPALPKRQKRRRLKNTGITKGGNMSRSKRAQREQLRTEMAGVMYNQYAIQEGPTQRKHWSLHDLKRVHPLTEVQSLMYQNFEQGKNIYAHGTAGTGKTFLALYLALTQLLNPDSEIKRIIVVRSIVPSRDIGFLPGDVDEKIGVYETPYKDILQELLGRASTYDDMKAAGLIEFMPTSFVRGTTWDNAVVIVDECQNLIWDEINSVMTRIGKNSRVIIAGDTKQPDLRKKDEITCLTKLPQIVDRLKTFARIEFTAEDIVRSKFVRDWIIAVEGGTTEEIVVSNDNLYHIPPAVGSLLRRA